MMENITAAAQKQAFDPWHIPDTFTMYAYAPEDIRHFMHPHWQTQKAIHPVWYYAIGLYFLFIGNTAVFGNLFVLRIFSRFQALRTPSNMLVMNLAVSDFLLMASLLPELLFNFFSGGPWRFGEMACQIHAFCGAFFGYSQITTLVFISWDRYNVIVHGMAGTPLTFSKVTVILVFNWLWSFAWALCPLVGWGLYTMDGLMGTCSFDALTPSLNNQTHILATTVCFYLAPIIVIAGCYFRIVQTVFKHEDEMRQQAKKMNVTSLRTSSDQKQVSAEIRIAKIAIVNVAIWIVAWTPFTIVCMWGTWGDSSWITPFISELPVLFAKTSAAYNPMVYALSHPKYREYLKELYPWVCITIQNKKKTVGDGKSIITVQTETHSSTSDDVHPS